MSFTEIDLFGVYVVSISVMLLALMTGSVDFAAMDRLGGGVILLFGSPILIIASARHAARPHAS